MVQFWKNGIVFERKLVNLIKKNLKTVFANGHCLTNTESTLEMHNLGSELESLAAESF